MARRKFHKVIADYLHGDITKPEPLDDAALKEQGWQWSGVSLEQQEETRRRLAREQEPSPHAKKMLRHGFRPL